MEITFDLAKHGLSLEWASELDWDAMMVRFDERRNYGEARMVGFAPIADRLYCVVYTDRGDQRRIISLRKANSREVLDYANQN